MIDIELTDSGRSKVAAYQRARLEREIESLKVSRRSYASCAMNSSTAASFDSYTKAIEDIDIAIEKRLRMIGATERS